MYLPQPLIACVNGEGHCSKSSTTISSDLEISVFELGFYSSHSEHEWTSAKENKTIQIVYV